MTMTGTASFPIAVTLMVGALLAGCGASTGSGGRQQASRAQTRSRIAFVSCMRAHGVTRFPYPTADGHVSVAMVRAQGINPQSPAVARVVSECLPPWLRPPKGR